MGRLHGERVAFALAMLASCKSCDDPPTPPADTGAPETATSPIDAASDASPITIAKSDASDTVVTLDASVGDGGLSSCRLAYGPAEQSFRGPPALAVTPTELRLVTNDAGKPRTTTLPLSPPPPRGAPPPAPPPKPSSFVGMRWPPCELAGRFVYCQAHGGQITRTTLGMTDTKDVAKSRPGTRIAASALGADHSAVAFLDLRHTTEGPMLQAFVAIDDREPVRLSDDGAGATTLRLLPRGEGAVAAYLDSRTAMTPLHARALSLAGPAADDAVIYVGGPPERGIDFTLAMAGTQMLALVPMPRETTEFGMAAVKIEDPPKDDMPAVWSLYPNGLDPAPIAATAASKEPHAWVARVRLREKSRAEGKVLELGRVDATGAFTSYGVIADGKGITDIAIVEDGFGAVWIAYGDSNATWLERRACN